MKNLITKNKFYTKYKIPFPIIDIYFFKKESVNGYKIGD